MGFFCTFILQLWQCPNLSFSTCVNTVNIQVGSPVIVEQYWWSGRAEIFYKRQTLNGSRGSILLTGYLSFLNILQFLTTLNESVLIAKTKTLKSLTLSWVCSTRNMADQCDRYTHRPVTLCRNEDEISESIYYCFNSQISVTLIIDGILIPSEGLHGVHDSVHWLVQCRRDPPFPEKESNWVNLVQKIVNLVLLPRRSTWVLYLEDMSLCKFEINLRYNTYHQIICYNGRLWLFQWRFGYQVLCFSWFFELARSIMRAKEELQGDVKCNQFEFSVGARSACAHFWVSLM